MYISLTPLEIYWLNTRGGRGVIDVKVNIEGEKFIILQGIDISEKIEYIPSEIAIKELLNLN